MKTLSLILIFLCSISLFNCARNPIKHTHQSLRSIDAPAFIDKLEYSSFVESLKNTIASLEKRPEKILNFGERKISAARYIGSLRSILLKTKDAETLRTFIQQNFDCFEVYGRDEYGEILLTSYYEPLFKGSSKPTKKYSQALYALPKDFIEVDIRSFARDGLGNFDTNRRRIGARVIERAGAPNKIVPFYSREEIDIKNKLKGKNLELVYVDPIEAFFLQVQGSGTVVVNGKKLRLGYAGQNGWKYESIGKNLLHIIPREEMSLQKIEEHLRTLNKKELYSFLKINPSYVFFKELEGKAITTSGAEVTAGRTLAIDPSMFPLGALGYLEFPKPIFEHSTSTGPHSFDETSRFVFAQDTGGAIKGPGRADLFWGSGKQAKQSAGVMKHPARLYFLAPKI